MLPFSVVLVLHQPSDMQYLPDVLSHYDASKKGTWTTISLKIKFTKLDTMKKEGTVQIILLYFGCWGP